MTVAGLFVLCTVALCSLLPTRSSASRACSSASSNQPALLWRWLPSMQHRHPRRTRSLPLELPALRWLLRGRSGSVLLLAERAVVLCVRGVQGTELVSEVALHRHPLIPQRPNGVATPHRMNRMKAFNSGNR